MIYPHRIRLRGPWECEPLVNAAGGPAPPRCSMVMPCRWGAGGLKGFTGQVRFLRRFGFPGRIDAHERVWLTFAGITGFARIAMNGKSLGDIDSDSAFAFEVTTLLQPRNQLLVDVTANGDDGGLWGEVALEVRCTAFLQDVRFSFGDHLLEAAGKVVGTADRALELYLLANQQTVAYQVVEPAVEGQPFTIGGETDSQGPVHARLELVNGAVVWYQVAHGHE